MPRKKKEVAEQESLLDIDALLEQREVKTEAKKKRASKKASTTSVRKINKKEQQIIELASKTVMPDHYFTVWTLEDLFEFRRWLAAQDTIALDTETMGLNPFADEIVGMSFYAPHRGYYIPLKHIDHTEEEQQGVIGIDYVRCLPKQVVIDALKPIIEDPSKKWILHNAKFDMHVCREWLGIVFKPFFDTMVAQALLDENQSKALKDMAPYYLKIPADRFGTLFGKTTFDKVPIKMNAEKIGNLASYYAIKDTELTFKMYQFQMPRMAHPRLKEIYDLMFNIEMPFLMIVTEAEAQGVELNTKYLMEEVAPKLHAEVETLRQKIWAHTGQINLNSAPQLSEALYTKLGLPHVNEKKPMSTDKKTLKKLKKEHDVISLILEYREKVKLCQAFVDKLPAKVVRGIVHTSFNPVGTKTGRMSSNSPNLQQIPAKIGGLIRNAFVAREGRLLASLDFSQQELRVLGHVSKDEVLLDIYRSGKDVHSMTATGMWNRKHQDQQLTYTEFEYKRKMTTLFQDEDGNIIKSRFTDDAYIARLVLDGKIDTTDPKVLKADAEMGIALEKVRKDAKVVNFGIIYGMSELGLAETLEITVEEAIEYIQGYFDAYPGVKKWMAEQRKFIKEKEYSVTMLGRKRRVYKEMRSGEWWMENRGYRMGINAIIQGSSADMVKLASIQLQPLLKELNVKIVLWVHDEIIFDVPEGIGMENLQKMADIMCNALPLDCGLKSDIEVGKKWGQRMSEDDIRLLFRAKQQEEEEEEDEEEEEAMAV